MPANLLTLAVSCLTFLTTIWGDGVVFNWFINLTGISSLLVWGTIGAISLRFRAAWRTQGRDLADLPYRQPLFPVLPLMVVILAVLMFIAQGYAAVVQEPFSVRVSRPCSRPRDRADPARRTSSRRTSASGCTSSRTSATRSGSASSCARRTTLCPSTRSTSTPTPCGPPARARPSVRARLRRSACRTRWTRRHLGLGIG